MRLSFCGFISITLLVIPQSYISHAHTDTHTFSLFYFVLPGFLIFLPSMSQATHKAVVTVSPRAPLELISVPTPIPKSNEIRIRGEWTASTPLDLHQADGGLLVTHPQVLGDSLVGTVVEVGEGVKRFVVGDAVMGFSWRGQGEKTHQEFTVGEEVLFGLVSRVGPFSFLPPR